MADLAARGTVFPHVVAASNWTLPSHASMFTGLLPGPLGLNDPPTIGRGLASRPLLEANADRVLAEVLRRRGYETRAVSSNPFISEASGFATGFDEFRSIHGGRRRPKGGFRSNLELVKDALEGGFDDGADKAEGIIQRWMAERTGRPFFWFVNLMECHAPYLPPRPYNDLSAAGRIRAAREAARYQTPEALYRVCAGQLDVPEEILARMRHLYARSIKRMDDWLARILGELDARGALQDTVVVVTSDHGENIGENHLVGHAFSMDDRLLRVPLVVSAPDRLPVESFMSLAELPRLLASAIGFEHPAWREAPRPRGFAVSQAAGQVMLRSEDDVEKWERRGVSEEAVRAVGAPITAATNGRHKLVRDKEGESLYDLQADPLELRPVVMGEAEAADVPVTEMRGAIDDVERAVPVRGAGAAPSDIAQESAELEERLRLLGYV